MVFIKLVLLLLFPLRAEISIDVEGSAFIEDNISNARIEAKKDAFISALRITLINLSKSPDLVKNNEFKLKYKIYPNAKDYVDSYNVISEEKTKDILKENMSIVINTSKLKNDLIKFGISLEQKSVPKIISFIAEKKTNSMFGYSYIEKNGFTDIEDNFSKYLSDKGFALINPYEDENNFFPSSNTFLFLKTSELISYAKKYSSDLISTGYTHTDCNSKELITEFKCTTVISIQVLSAENAKIIAAKKVKETFVSKTKDEAYEKSRLAAIKSISDNLIYQLTKHWKDTKYKNYNITVTKLKNYELYSNIKKAIDSSEVENIANVIEKYQYKNAIILNVDVSTDNYEKSRRIILRKIKESINYKIMESKDENITIEII